MYTKCQHDFNHLLQAEKHTNNIQWHTLLRYTCQKQELDKSSEYLLNQGYIYHNHWPFVQYI